MREGLSCARLVAVAVVMFAAALWLARSGGRPDRGGGPDDGKERLVWRADAARRGTGRGRHQCRGRRARPAGAAHHGGRFCDPEQAVAAAQKLVSDGVIFVVGHYCSEASIPASEVYEAAGSCRSRRRRPIRADRTGPRQRFPRHRPRRCGRHRGRQLPGRSLG